MREGKEEEEREVGRWSKRSDTQVAITQLTQVYLFMQFNPANSQAYYYKTLIIYCTHRHTFAVWQLQKDLKCTATGE